MADWRRERRELMDYLLEQDWDVFGTLKFVDGRRIGGSTADKLLRSYWNRIDRMFFGHAADRKGVLQTTIDNLKDRQLNSSYGCAYYPWVQIRDTINNRLVTQKTTTSTSY